jgi:protein NirF
MLALCPGLLAPRAGAEGIGSRVFVVERESGSLAVYDYLERRLMPRRITGLGNLRHATMIFSPDLRYGYLATRSGQVSRIDLETLARTGEVFTSESSIDNAISQDGRLIATAEYAPGGVTILDARDLRVVSKHPATFTRDGQTLPSRVTGIVDAPGNRFVCVLMEGSEIWVIDASGPEPAIEHRVPTSQDLPYDAMITPDGRYYLVGHMNSARVSLLDLSRPQAGVREISLRDPARSYDKAAPVKLPHMASWAVAGKWVFVPLVGESRLAVLHRETWNFERSIPLRGHPVYAVRSPTEREVWVSFSGEQDDAFVQVIDTERLEVADTLEVGGRIYHMDFTPRGAHVLVSANRDNKLFLVNATTRRIEDSQELASPSGIFGVWRAFRIGL